MNYNQCAAAFHLTFAKPLAGKTLYRHLYDPNRVEPTAEAEIIGVSAQLEQVTAEFSDTIPAGAVAIYTTRADEIESL